MGRYKMYLFKDGKIPRSTAAMRRSRAKARELQQLQTVNALERVDSRQTPEQECDKELSGRNKNSEDGVCSAHNDENDDDDERDFTQEGEMFSLEEPTSIQDGLQENVSMGEDQHEDSDILCPDENFHHKKQSPLCSHTECTPDDVLLMCLSLSYRHGLSWAAVEDILKMINAIYGKTKIKTSKHMFMKTLIEKEKLDVKYHCYCPQCSCYVGKTELLKGCMLCPNCKKDVDASEAKNYFVSLSLGSQIQQMLKNPQIAEMILTYRFNRVKEKSSNLEDIYDGSEYKKKASPGEILSYPENFSYSFFVDGVALGKNNSRKKSMWPIYVAINELPPKERSRNLLLCGLYVGPKDPDQTIFMKPFVAEANELSTEGISWNYKGKGMISKVIPLVLVADSVARCQLLNLQTFSAVRGCTFCYHKSVRTLKRLKFAITNKPLKLRTMESYLQDLRKAFELRYEKKDRDRQYKGVKGPSALAILKYFDMFTGTVVDYLHNILLGVCKTYFQLVFDNRRRKFWGVFEDDVYAMEDILSAIDVKLTAITPPSSITRTPRSIEYYSNWKASEWRSWLLFYSIPCLKGLLKDEHLCHFAMLSKATSLLLQKSISHADVEEAHKLLKCFTFLYQEYFGELHMYYNIHLLSHVCTGVLRWGPLFTHNAFMYESKNREILQLAKNPDSVVLEVSKKYLILKNFPSYCEKMATTDHAILFCQDVMDRRLVRFSRCGSCILLGKANTLDLLRPSDKDCLQDFGVIPSDCLFYNRMLYSGMRITTANYAHKKKNNDSYVYSSSHYLSVQAICLSQSHGVVLILEKVLLVEEIVLSGEHVNIQHIRQLSHYGGLVCVQVECILGQLVCVRTDTDTYFTKLPAGCYGD